MLEKKTLEVEKTVIVGIINAQQDERKVKRIPRRTRFFGPNGGGESHSSLHPKNQPSQPQNFYWKR